MSPNADIIRQVIIDGGLGADSGLVWPVNTGFLPDEVDDAIVVYDTSGIKDGRVMTTGEQVTHPGVQVRVRGISYPDVFKKAQDIAAELDNTFGISIDMGADSYRISNISRIGDILPMGVEVDGDRRRFNFTINAVLTITKL